MTQELFDKAYCINMEIWGLENGLRQLRKVRKNKLVDLSACDISSDAEDFFKESENRCLDILVFDVENRIELLKVQFDAL